MREPDLVEELLSLGEGIWCPDHGPAECAARGRLRGFSPGERQSALGAGVLLAQAFRKPGRPHNRAAAMTKRRAWASRNLVGISYGWRRDEAWGS